MEWLKALNETSGVTAEEAIVNAGLDWNVNKRDLYYMDTDGRAKPIHGQYANVRDDNGYPVGIVGAQYVVLQNRDKFRLLNSIVGETGAHFVRAGALKGGSLIYVQAKLPDSIQVTRDDTLDKYLTALGSHDGSTPVSVGFTTVRVACQNTFNAALADGEYKIKHTASMASKLADIGGAIGILNSTSDILKDMSSRMLDRKLGPVGTETYLRQVLGIGTADQGARAVNRLAAVTLLATNGRGNGGDAYGTLWAAFNAITDYADHNDPAKSKASRQEMLDRRAVSNLVGNGHKLKVRAWREAVSLVAK
jgi:phage/plasmid-like protein (TIGR03299 family)